MNRILVLLAVALLGLTACGAGEDAGSGGPAESTTSEPTALPDVARIVCDENGARLETPSVKAQPDGIHFEIVNEAGGERSLSIQNAEGTGTGMGIPAGTSTQVVDIEPGALTVVLHRSCHRAGRRRGARGRGRGRHLGLDPSRPVPSSSRRSSTTSRAPPARPPIRLVAARKAVEGFGLEPDDVFERAGYPDTDTARVRMVRGSEPVAIVDLIDDGTGKWLVSMVTGCSSLEN